MALLQLSFSGAVLILAIVTIRAVAINRLPKKTFLILWEISIARLLLPVSIPSIFSVYSLINRNAPLHDTVEASPAAVLLPGAERTAPLAEIQPAAHTPETETISAALVLYCVVALLLAACFTASYLHCRMEFRASLPVSNEFTRNWLLSHPLRRPLEIRESDRILAPLTYGIARPVILMPRKTDWQNREQLQYVLAHEYIHICRWDALAKLIAAAALVIHWFNPFVWAMYMFFNRDIELSCDERLVRWYGQDSRSAYALTLIGMEEEKSGLLPLYNSFSKNAIEERITAIMKTKKLTVAASAVSILILAAAVLVFATSAKADNSSRSLSSSMQRANESLTSYLTACGILQDDMTTADGSVMEWDVRSAKEIELEETACYAFDLRFSDDAGRNGEMAGRLSGSYAVSENAQIFYHYNPADDLWEAYDAATRLETPPGNAAEYPVCAIVRGMTEDTLTVDVVEFITSDDAGRVKELGLTEEADMPDGYYINMDNPKRATWQLTDQTSYTFIDWGGDFTADRYPGYCVTMDRATFEKYLKTYPPFDEMRMPFFFKVEDGAVKGVFEYPFM